MKTSTYQVNALSVAERDQLSQELYPLHQQVFSGVSQHEFRRYVLDSLAWKTWLYVQRTPAGQAVGYLALHAFKKTLLGRSYLIYRMETGKLPAFRGRDLSLLRAIVQILRVGFRYPWRPSYLFATPVYPAPYALAAKYSYAIWPRRDRPTPPRQQQLLRELAEDYHLPLADEQNPLVRRINWFTREEGTRPTRWSARLNPHATYFVAQNPNYAQGLGLMTIVPSTLFSVVFFIVHFAVARSARTVWRRFAHPALARTAGYSSNNKC